MELRKPGADRSPKAAQNADCGTDGPEGEQDAQAARSAGQRIQHCALFDPYFSQQVAQTRHLFLESRNALSVRLLGGVMRNHLGAPAHAPAPLSSIYPNVNTPMVGPLMALRKPIWPVVVTIWP